MYLSGVYCRVGENFAFLPEMQFSWFYFCIITATVRVGNSLDEFSHGEIFANFD